MYLVYSTADSGGGSLRTALANANQDEDSVIAFTASGVIDLESPLPAISRDVQILGPGANNLTVSGNGANREFDISGGVTATIAGLTIADGVAGLGGGVFVNSGATLSLADCTLSGNSASQDGGAIFNFGTLLVTDSTLSANSTPVGGGGIENSGTLTLTNSTVSGNSAGSGGGIDNDDMLTVTNSTISGNSAGFNGGVENDSTAIIANTIIANNTAAAGGSDVFGTFDSMGFNLIGNSAGGIGFVATDLQSVNPLLGPLQNNGGPTQTMALLPGSPAIGAGSVALIPAGITTDQRGFCARSRAQSTAVPSSRAASPPRSQAAITSRRP